MRHFKFDMTLLSSLFIHQLWSIFNTQLLHDLHAKTMYICNQGKNRDDKKQNNGSIACN